MMRMSDALTGAWRVSRVSAAGRACVCLAAALSFPVARLWCGRERGGRAGVAVRAGSALCVSV